VIVKHIYRSDRWPEYRSGCRSREECLRLFRYLTRPDKKHEVLRNDFAGDTPEAIADHLALLHQGQRFWGYHVVASHPKDEKGLWRPKAKACIQELHDRCQIESGFWVLHDDHWHGFLMSMEGQFG